MLNTRKTSQRGFSLLEAMIAMLITAFAMLALAGMQNVLSKNAEIAKQRTEATRLAQQQIETMRSYTSETAWSALGSNTGTATLASTIGSNTDYTMSWTLGGSSTDTMRALNVNVSWTDRSGTTGGLNSVTLNTVISNTNPDYVGAMGFPQANNSPLKQPKNRSLNIPVPAVDLPDGKSGTNLGGSAYIFSDATGGVVQQCLNYTVSTSTTSADIAAHCSTFSGYIVAGYVTRSGTMSWPTGISTAGISNAGAGTITCSFGDATNQNTNATISGYKYYLCVVPVTTGGSWSGTVRLTGVTTTGHIVVCRMQYASSTYTDSNQRNVQPYSSVTESLDNQSYILNDSASAACPTVDSLDTTLHQDCRSGQATSTTCPVS